MKPLLTILFAGLILSCFGMVQAFSERAKLALKSGNSQKILALIGSEVELGFEGEAVTMQKKQAEILLTRFFKDNPPEDFVPLFQGQSKDNRQYLVGQLKTPKGLFRVSAYWTQVPREEIQSLDFSAE